MIAVQASAQDPGTGAESKPAARTVKFPDGTIVPALGQGSWHLGQGRHPLSVEEEAMRTGIALGMTVIDTSRNYGDGRSEKFIGRVIAGQRDRVFLVSKVQEDEIVRIGRRSRDRWMARATDRASLRGEPRSSRHRLSRSLFAAFASPQQVSRRRCSQIRTTARGGKDSRLGRLQLQRRPNGRAVPCSGRPSMRNQSGSLQSQ